MPETINCGRCDVELEGEYREGIFEVDGETIGPFCVDCWQKTKLCTKCKKPHAWGEDIDYYDEGHYLCDTCASEHLETCEGCGRPSIALVALNGDSDRVCNRCIEDLFKCGICGNHHMKEVRYTWHEDGINKHHYPSFAEKYGDDVCETCFDANKHRFKYHNVYKCKACDAIHSHSFTHNGVEYNDLCSYCHEEYVYICHTCDNVHESRTSKRTVGNILAENGESQRVSICPSCFNRSWAKCSACQFLVNKWDKSKPIITDLQGNSICHDCQTNRKLCKACGVYSAESAMTRDPNGNLCDGCYTRSQPCSKCGVRDHFTRRVRRGGSRVSSLVVQTVEDDESNRHLCLECSKDEGTPHIYSYSFKPVPEPVGGKYEPEKLLLGFENEMSVKEDYNVAETLAMVLKHYDKSIVFPKTDSSVRNGFEIVSQPMTFDVFNEIDWSHLHPTERLRTDLRAGAGMHVHMSKANFMNFHLYKFINFMYSNHEFIVKVSERPANGYCERITDYDRIKKMSKEKTTSGRPFIALNKKSTMEIRCFHGPTTEFQLRKNVEFLQALYEFTKDNAPKDITEINYRQYVEDNAKKFSNISKFLNDNE